MARILSVIASVVLGCICLAGATSVDDFMPHQNTTKEFNETWSYQFVFDNGTRAFVNYSTLYIPATGKKIGCDLTFWNFKGKTYTVGRQYPPERLKADKANATLDIKGEYLMEHKPGKGHRVMYSADKGGKFLLDVTFESAEGAPNASNHVWNIGKDKFAQYVHIPYGRVSGKIAYNEDTLQVKGYAYMDQTWQTSQATDIAIRSINFSTNGRSPLYAGRISITHDKKLVGYALYNSGNGIKVVTPKSISDGQENYSGKGFPKGDITIQWNEDVPPLKFNAQKPFQKASILDKVEGWIAKKAFKIAAGGEVLFYRGRSELENGKKLDWAITGVKD
ncbi:MAG: hypothetical protein MJZ26_08210 [Fibrobacter sp.]|nr:hypothetical protein [Fibrobacter sp.]